MISVSEGERDWLAANRVRGYLDRVAERIRRDFRSELVDVGNADLRGMIETAFRRFHGCGFRLKEHLHRLIVLEVLFGPFFEVHLPDEVRAIMEWTTTSALLPEAERFWTIYRAAESLARGNGSSSQPSSE